MASNLKFKLKTKLGTILAIVKKCPFAVPATVPMTTRPCHELVTLHALCKLFGSAWIRKPNEREAPVLFLIDLSPVHRHVEVIVLTFETKRVNQAANLYKVFV